MYLPSIIKKPILTVLRSYHKYKQEKVWKQQTQYWRGKISPIQLMNIPHYEKILILAPHDDDEWIGCSHFIRNYQNAIVCNMDMDGGDTSEMHAVRLQEMKNLASMFGREFVTVDKDKIITLKKIVLEKRPDYICVPCFFDWHPEHIQVMNILKEVLILSKYSCQVVMYQVSLPIPPSLCNMVIPFNSRVFKYKWNTFVNVYPTQTKIAYKRFMANEQINGALANAYAAEVYVVNSSDDWLNMFDYLLTSEDKEIIKNNLSDITFVRDTINEFLNKRAQL